MPPDVNTISFGIAAYILGKIGNSVGDADSVESLVENLVESLGDDSPDVRKSSATLH